MPKKIILVRHGETDFNKEKILQGHADTYLNKTGLEQAIAVSGILVKEKIDVIYSSNLKRAHQTAQIIAEKLHKKIILTSLLQERNFGGFEGLKGSEIGKYYKHLSFSWQNGLSDSVSAFFKVETDKKMIKRVKKFLAYLKKKHTNQNVLLVLHGGVIWTFLRIFDIQDKIIEEGKLFANTSVTLFEKKKKGYEIKKINQ